MSPEVKAEIEQLQGRVAALELSNAQVLVLIIAPLPTTDRELFLANAGIQHEDRLKRLATGLQGPSMDTLERICTSVLETCRGFDKHRKTQEQGN